MSDEIININKEQLEKLFYLADINEPSEQTSLDITKALLEIEKKLTVCSIEKSCLDSTGNIASVLIVDDLELSVHQLSLLLSRSGYDVHVAKSFTEAVDKLKKRTYQYILLDLFLPDYKDGFKLLEIAKESIKANNIDTKIILISGTDDKKLIRDCFLKGADDFIEKSPEWHKNILNRIRQFENRTNGYDKEIITNIEDKDAKIASIIILNLNKDELIQELEKELLVLVNSGFNNIILDMKNITNLNSKAINSLISMYKACIEHNGSLKLYNIGTAVNEILSYVFLNKVLQIFENKESALQSFYNE